MPDGETTQVIDLNGSDFKCSVDRDGSGAISANELANVAVGGIRLGIDLAIKVWYQIINK